MVIKNEFGIFEVDISKTKQYYKRKHPCECDLCVFFREKIGEAEPKLVEFLEGFGVNAAEPDEINISFEDGEMYSYRGVNYTVCGRIKAVAPNVLLAGSNIELCFENGFCCPNSQEGEYFTICTESTITIPKQ